MSWRSTITVELNHGSKDSHEHLSKVILTLVRSYIDTVKDEHPDVVLSQHRDTFEVCQTCSDFGLESWADRVHAPANECHGCQNPEEHHEPD
jgi:hypothetical protein